MSDVISLRERVAQAELAAANCQETEEEEDQGHRSSAKPKGSSSALAAKRWIRQNEVREPVDRSRSASLTCFSSSLAYFEGLGLVRQVLAPASANKRQAPQWQRQKAKGKVERINPNTCQRRDRRSIRRSFCLGELIQHREMPLIFRSSMASCFAFSFA